MRRHVLGSGAPFVLLVLSFGQITAQDLLSTADSDVPHDLFGRALALTDDFDGDGLPDFAVGAPGRDDSGPDAGAVFIYSSSSRNLLRRADGTATGAWFGATLVPFVDVDGDGLDEFLVGAPFQSTVGTRAGAIHLLSGATFATLGRIDGAPADELATSLAVLPDLDGDGIAEVLAGAPGGSSVAGGAGAVLAFSGATGAQLFRVDGTLFNDHLGASLAVIDDVDGDGVQDFAVGTPGHDAAAGDEGRVEVYSTGTLARLFTADGNRYKDGLGEALAALPDVDGDGYRDLVAGAPGFGNALRRGEVDVVSGLDGHLILRLTGISPQSFFGTAVASAGDVNGDGRPDLLVGSPAEDSNGINAGRVWVFDAQNGIVLARVPGPRAYANLGVGLLGGLDLDSDGFSEFLTGAPIGPGGLGNGTVGTYEGREIMLDAEPPVVTAGQQTLTLSGHAGLPNSPWLLFLEAVDGVPTLKFLGAGTLDATGGFVWDTRIHGNTRGHDAQIRFYSIASGGRPARSNLVLIESK